MQHGSPGASKLRSSSISDCCSSVSDDHEFMQTSEIFTISINKHSCSPRLKSCMCSSDSSSHVHVNRVTSTVSWAVPSQPIVFHGTYPIDEPLTKEPSSEHGANDTLSDNCGSSPCDITMTTFALFQNRFVHRTVPKARTYPIEIQCCVEPHLCEEHYHLLYHTYPVSKVVVCDCDKSHREFCDIMPFNPQSSKVHHALCTSRVRFQYVQE